MLISDKPNPLFENVATQMMEANWVKDYIYEEGSGYRFRWSPPGLERAFLLQEAIRQNELLSEREAVRFTRVCRGKEAPAAGEEITAELCAFWLACMDELEIEEPEISTFVQVIDHWQPDRSQMFS